MKLVKDEKGFTLIELTVTMTLLLIISVIAITRYAGMIEKSKIQFDYYLASAIASSSKAWISEEIRYILTS